MKRSTDRILADHVGNLVRPTSVRHSCRHATMGSRMTRREYQKITAFRETGRIPLMLFHTGRWDQFRHLVRAGLS